MNSFSPEIWAPGLHRSNSQNALGHSRQASSNSNNIQGGETAAPAALVSTDQPPPVSNTFFSSPSHSLYPLHLKSIFQSEEDELDELDLDAKTRSTLKRGNSLHHANTKAAKDKENSADTAQHSPTNSPLQSPSLSPVHSHSALAGLSRSGTNSSKSPVNYPQNSVNSQISHKNGRQPSVGNFGNSGFFSMPRTASNLVLSAFINEPPSRSCLTELESLTFHSPSIVFLESPAIAPEDANSSIIVPDNGSPAAVALNPPLLPTSSRRHKRNVSLSSKPHTDTHAIDTNGQQKHNIIYRIFHPLSQDELHVMLHPPKSPAVYSPPIEDNSPVSPLQSTAQSSQSLPAPSSSTSASDTIGIFKGLLNGRHTKQSSRVVDIQQESIEEIAPPSLLRKEGSHTNLFREIWNRHHKEEPSSTASSDDTLTVVMCAVPASTPERPEKTTGDSTPTSGATSPKISSTPEIPEARFFDLISNKLGRHKRAQSHSQSQIHPSKSIDSLVDLSNGTHTPVLSPPIPRSASDVSLNEKYGKPATILGRGANATVRLAHKVEGASEKIYAVKEFRRKRREETQKEYVKKLISEFCISSSLHHENIVETVDLIQDEVSRWCEVMEFCAGGDMYTRLHAGTLTDSGEGLCYWKQMVHGVAYLHSMGVAHRDLKPENLLIEASGCILKITDFGTSYVFRNPFGCSSPNRVRGVCGSTPYIAPEEFIPDSDYDPTQVDVWAMGIIFYVMSYNSVPWKIAKREDTHYRYYLQNRAKFWPIERLHFGQRKLMYRLLDPDPLKRITIAEILQDEWFQSIEYCHYDSVGTCIASKSHTHPKPSLPVTLRGVNVVDAKTPTFSLSLSNQSSPTSSSSSPVESCSPRSSASSVAGFHIDEDAAVSFTASHLRSPAANVAFSHARSSSSSASSLSLGPSACLDNKEN